MAKRKRRLLKVQVIHIKYNTLLESKCIDNRHGDPKSALFYTDHFTKTIEAAIEQL